MQEKNNEVYLKEDILQLHCVQYFYQRYSYSGAILHHSPNENPSGDKIKMIRYNAKMNAMGRVKGWPDLQICWEGKTIFFELKSATGRVTESQKIIHKQLKATGHIVHIIKTLHEFKFYCDLFFLK